MKQVANLTRLKNSFYMIAASVLISACGQNPANSLSTQNFTTDQNQDENGGIGADPSQTIRIFGDSIFTAGGNMIAQELERLLQRRINSHAVGGTVITQIREQYRSARQMGTRTAIMDGGGNDVLGARGDCQNQLSPRCRSIVENAVAVAKDIFSMMAQDGVSNVVHLGCHYPMGWSGGFDAAVDYSFTLLDQACRDSGANCILIDPRQTFRGRNDLLEWDGVHPNRGGAQAFAKLIREGIEQAGMQL